MVPVSASITSRTGAYALAGQSYSRARSLLRHARERMGRQAGCTRDRQWRQTVQSAARRFVGAAQSADVAIFYYSGHAVQFNGVNYLMPVDAKVEGEAEWSRSIPRITSKFMRLSAAATSSADDRVLHSGPLPVYES
jgi:hypothetical protein